MADPTRHALTAVPTASAATDAAPVVVGVDGSALDETLVPLAAREAARYGRPLRIVHTFNWSADPSTPIPAEVLRDPAQQVLDEAVAAGHRTEPAVQVSAALLEGPPVTVLLRESGAAALLVIGDGGLGGCDCVPVDAPALIMTARAGCSVLIGRSTVPPPGPVLVGVDGSSPARLALGQAFDAALRRGRKLVAIRVWDPVEDPALTEPRVALELDNEVGSVRRHVPDVEVEARVRVGDPTDVMVREAADAELVIVAARGEHPWRGMLGEVSQALLYHTTTPLLIVRGRHELYVQA